MYNRKSMGLIAIVSTMILGSLVLPGKTSAETEGWASLPYIDANIPFAVIPEPEGGRTIDYALDKAIQDAESWSAFWNEIHPGEPVPVIDFETKMVVATALGGGNRSSMIEVTRVEKSRLGSSPLTKVRIRETRPGLNCVVPLIYAPPPHVLIVTEKDDDVSFRRTNVVRNCP